MTCESSSMRSHFAGQKSQLTGTTASAVVSPALHNICENQPLYRLQRRIRLLHISHYIKSSQGVSKYAVLKCHVGKHRQASLQMVQTELQLLRLMCRHTTYRYFRLRVQQADRAGCPARPFMRRVHVEIPLHNQSHGSREKLILLLLCAAPRDLPGSRTGWQNTCVTGLRPHSQKYLRDQLASA